MANIISKTNIKEVSWHGVVIRCGCNNEQKQSNDWHGNKNEVCPNPKEVKDLGIMAYSTSNPFKYLLWKLKRLLSK